MAQPPKDTEANIIPEGSRPLGFMSAIADNQKYAFHPSLEKAREQSDATMVMEVDYGGQVLLTCPVRDIKATERTITHLLADLEDLTWGNGFQSEPHQPSNDAGAGIYFESHCVGSAIPGGMGGAAVIDGLWVHPQIEHEFFLRSQVEGVITGRMERLNVPVGFPRQEWRGALGLKHAKEAPHGRIQLRSGIHRWIMLSCSARLVRISHEELISLVRLLDQHTQHLITHNIVRTTFLNNEIPYFHTVEYVVRERYDWNGNPEDDCHVFPDSRLTQHRDEILSKLRGESTRAEM